MLGTPLMPWQQYVADVALEVDPHTGLLVYREVGLTVPRQSGKTTLLLSAMVQRALGFGTKQRILYTAQTRGAARTKWEDEHVEILESSKFRKMFKVRRQLGQENIRWNNGSKHGISSNTEKAGHGETLDQGVIDEAFAQEDDRLEQAFKPAMITRPQPQLWYLSTAGTVKSIYLRGKVDAGRLRCEAGLTQDACYFEWSAPGTLDPGAVETWRSCMPALGYTVTEAAIRAEFTTMKLAEFRRAFLNQWPDDAPDGWLVIDQDAWEALADPGSAIVGKVAICADMTPERSAGSIAVAGLRADGLHHVEVIEHRTGTRWMKKRLIELNTSWNPCALVIDGAGPAGSLIADLEAAGVEVVRPTGRDVTQAWGDFYTAVVPEADEDGVAAGEPTLRHLDQAPLNAALAGAQERQLGDASALARRAASADISPLVAVTLARWGFVTRGHVENGPVKIDGPLGV